jgi:hypothetical protein
MEFSLFPLLKKQTYAYQITVLSVGLPINFWTSLRISTKSGVNLNTIINPNILIINFPQPEITNSMADEGSYEVGAKPYLWPRLILKNVQLC